MFLLHALDKRINDLTNQLIALEVVGIANEQKYERILKELLELTEQRELFHDTWSKNFPHWFKS